MFLLKNASKRSGKFVPQVENLENRWCPSASITQTGALLVIKGDGSGDTIGITDNGQGGVSATLVSKHASISKSFTGVNAIVVDSGDGADTVNFGLSGSLTKNLALTLHLGKGNDQANLDFTAGISGATLSLIADAGLGTDTIDAHFGSITNANVLFNAFGGGADATNLDFSGAISGSKVKAKINDGPSGSSAQVELGSISASKVTVEAYLGAGSDAFTGSLNGAVTSGSKVKVIVNPNTGPSDSTFTATGANIDATSSVSLKFNGGKGTDDTSVSYDGQIDGHLSVIEYGGKGSDTLSENITADAGSTGDIYARVYGGKGNDNETLNVFDHSSGASAKSTLHTLDAVLWAVLGDNTITHTANVKVRTKKS